MASGYPRNPKRRLIPLVMPDHVPAAVDDLAAFEADCWSILMRAAADKRAAMNTLVLCTTGGDSAPHARTVVLRRVDRASRALHIHTDARSPKIAELHHDPRVVIVGWDPRAHLQLRIDGQATIHISDAVAADGWARTHGGARRLYAERTPPGTPLPAPTDFDLPLDPEAGRQAFAVIVVAIDVIEALRLGREGHRRARFTATSATWLAP